MIKKVVESMKEREAKALQEGLVVGCHMKPVSGQVYSVEDIATAKAKEEEEKQKAQKMKADKQEKKRNKRRRESTGNEAKK